MIIVALIVFGLILGSFVNAAVWRVHEQQKISRSSKRKMKVSTSDRNLSIVTGRSMCTHCGHQLATADLIPIVSYVYLRGRCRYCGKPIEDTPLAEILMPIVFVASYLWWPFAFTSWQASGSILFGFWLVFLVGFIFLSLYDVRWYLLPNKVVYPLIALAFLVVVIQALAYDGGMTVVMNAFWGIIFIAGVFYVLHAVSKGRWIGFGDVKLAVVLGALVGGPMNALLLIFTASLLGSTVALPLLVRGKATVTSRVPFGPFLMAATIIVMLFGTIITSWYKTLLGVH